MKNIHVLPTDKPSRLYIGDNGNFVFGIMRTSIQSRNDDFVNQHVYITSDEEIKDEDYYINLRNRPYINRSGKTKFKGLYDNCKKIILTTDQDLIKDGVQAIDDTFLEWFVKNPSCEEVEVINSLVRINAFDWKTDYKIIIPKEQTKLIKCYCGHTTYCDCEPEKSKQEILNQVRIKYNKSLTEEDKFEQHIKRMKGLRDVYEVGTGQHNVLSMLITECETALRQPPVGGSLRIAAQKLLEAVSKHHPQMAIDTQLDLYMAYHEVKEALSNDR